MDAEPESHRVEGGRRKPVGGDEDPGATVLLEPALDRRLDREALRESDDSVLVELDLDPRVDRHLRGSILRHAPHDVQRAAGPEGPFVEQGTGRVGELEAIHRVLQQRRAGLNDDFAGVVAGRDRQVCLGLNGQPLCQLDRGRRGQALQRKRRARIDAHALGRRREQVRGWLVRRQGKGCPVAIRCVRCGCIGWPRLTRRRR